MRKPIHHELQESRHAKKARQAFKASVVEFMVKMGNLNMVRWTSGEASRGSVRYAIQIVSDKRFETTSMPMIGVGAREDAEMIQDDLDWVCSVDELIDVWCCYGTRETAKYWR